MTVENAGRPVLVPHVVKGEIVHGEDLVYGSGSTAFATPALDLDQLIWSRRSPGPAFDIPLAEIMDVLVEAGRWLSRDPDGLVAETLQRLAPTTPLPMPVLARAFASLPGHFERPILEYQVATELGDPAYLDGWREMPAPPSARRHKVRAFPPRIVHIAAGNAPTVAAMTVVRGALTKGVHLIKLPSNDLFTATLLIRALAAVAPGHGVTRSFSAVYWRGGDRTVESMVFRPQYFDKLVAWGGERALRGAKDYVGPGFELVAFDPKTSISMIGREVFASPETLEEAADLAATDVTIFEQQACVSSRFQFIEANVEEADRYCALLAEKMKLERPYATASGRPLSGSLLEEIEGLRAVPGFCRTWGDHRNGGVVIRSDEPVEFHPDGRVVNVVPVARLDDALDQVNVATQTVGIYPPARKAGLRDALGSAGVQRIVDLGYAGGNETGIPHDGFFPLHRFMRWVNDEGGAA